MINEESINYAQKILNDRFLYFDKMGRKGDMMCAAKAISYKSACDILLAAVLDDKDILKEFDYYAD